MAPGSQRHSPSQEMSGAGNWLVLLIRRCLPPGPPHVNAALSIPDWRQLRVEAHMLLLVRFQLQGQA